MNSASPKFTLQDTQQAQSRFLANMGHEIRTPMNGILGFMKIVMDDDELPERLRRNLSAAYGSAERLFRLIDDILDLSKLQSGQVTLESKRFNLFRLIEILERRFAHKRNNGIGFDVVIDPRIDKYYSGDSFRLEQIVLALLGNAFKFTRQGYVRLEIVGGERVGDLSFHISDTGVGISEEALPTIFDAFVQADPSSTRTYGGAGMGLTIASELIRLMGGDISISSEHGVGTKVSFSIHLSPVSNDEYAFERGRVGELMPLSPRGFSVLVVDDIEVNLNLAKIHLDRENHRVILAKDGLEAIEMYQLHKPEVILMDIHMPYFDGIKATEHIRNLEKENQEESPSVIIAMTASILKDDLNRFGEYGFSYSISKPVDYSKLFNLLQEIVPESMGVPIERVETSSKEGELTEEELFKQIYEKLSLYNPTEVSTPLALLGYRIGDDAVAPIQKLIDMYEFDDALVFVENMAKERKIVL